MEQRPRDQVVELLSTRSVLKQDIYARIKETFALVKELLQEMTGDLQQEMAQRDDRVPITYTDRGELACEVRIAGDIIIFQMHTNIFLLDDSHSLWKGSYLEEDPSRGYFGVINMYNFLNDSFKYKRERDLGYLVSRLFVNKEGHFFMQGKRQLGFLFNDLANATLDKCRLEHALWSVLGYVIDFDLLAPPYDRVDQVTVMEMNEFSANMQPSTGKRLGFQFQVDTGEVSG
ncbi:MAG: hypothetical protein KDB88_10045 [Flavobacteriales bacterium]|nr:hypothetical protein [Flavobacteriales bacterium]